MSPARMDEFVRLLAAHQRRIYLYVHSLVYDANDAEEVLQETHLVLWREFGRFQPGTNFAAWACKVAMYQVLAWRKRRKRDRRSSGADFSDEFLETVAAETVERGDALEDRTEALAGCLEKLPPRHRQLLQERYADGMDIEAIADRQSRTTEAVYRALSRVRATLHECVSRSLARQRA